jgi:hypothetical protein
MQLGIQRLDAPADPLNVWSDSSGTMIPTLAMVFNLLRS